MRYDQRGLPPREPPRTPEPRGSEIAPRVYFDSDLVAPPEPRMSPIRWTLQQYERMGLRMHCLKFRRRPGGPPRVRWLH